MIPLAPQFKARGFSWRIVQRERDVAIVEQTKEGWSAPVLNVVIVQKHKARRLPNGEMTMDAEGIPSWEQWGDKAWTCADKADAKKRFNALVDAANGPQTNYVVGKAALSPPDPPDDPETVLIRRRIGNADAPETQVTPT